MKTALISVYNKKGIVEFAKEIQDLGFKILASGGTAKVLVEAGIEVEDVASLVGGGPILGHRVVTLSREVHAGLLAKDNAEDRAELEALKIPFIDLVCVDLYPLQEEINRVNFNHPGSNFAKASSDTSDALATPPILGGETAQDAVLEKTDIGGPTMIRSAAKGRRIVICEPSDRQKVVDWIKSGEQNREQFINDLCAKSEFIVADYVLASARYHSGGKYDGLIGEQILEAKYGENGWQLPAGLFADESARYTDPLVVTNFRLIAGTSPSYNNLADVDRLLQTMTHIAGGFDVNFSPSPNPSHQGRGTGPIPPPPSFAEASAGRQGEGKLHIAVGVKHGNPCGAAVSDDASTAIQKMLEGDLRAIFGGLVMVNFEVDENLAEIFMTHAMGFLTTPSPQSGATPPLQEGKTARRLLDGIIAPSFTEGAVEIMKRKGDKCRFLVNPALASLNKNSLDSHSRFRYVRGGFLKQPNYNFVLDFQKADVVAPFMGPNEPDKSGNYIENKLSDRQKSDIILAWAIGSTSNSNTVTIVKDGMLIGNGVGQQDRVSCCQLAIKRATDAHHEIKNATAYSDSFFPFIDGPQTLIDAGIKTIFASSGSVRDEEVKKVCQDNRVVLVMLPDKDARGFFGH